MSNKVSTNPWIFSFKKNELTRRRLLCFHHAGGGASFFRSWHQLLPPDLDVVCIQLPGREDRFQEPLACDFGEVISGVMEAILPLLTVPYFLFGHSLGALIALNVAIKIDQNHLKGPEHIFFSAHPAPSDKQLYYKRISHLPDREFIEELRLYNGIPEELSNNQELLDLYTPIIRSDFLLSEGAPKLVQPLPFSMSVYGGAEDKIPEPALQKWRSATTKNCDVRMFPGNHFFVISHVEEVLLAIRKTMDNQQPC